MKQIVKAITFPVTLACLMFSAGQAQNSIKADAHLVNIVAEEYAFSAPGEIPSGWSTFRLTNEGEETHFVFLTRLPDGKTFDNYMEEVAVHFNNAWHGIRTGKLTKTDVSEMLARQIPEWFYSAVRMGGPGLVEGGGSAQVTLKLEPGNYFMECYLKNADGEFHAIEGMARPLTVSTEPSGGVPPEADIEMILSNDGIEISDILKQGKSTIAVHFAEHPEAGPQHDIHLVRLDSQTNLSEVVDWLNWMNVDGFNTPVSTVFKGGAHEMPPGYTAYLTVELEPGRYAWVSQLTAAQGMVKEFTVEP